MVSLSLCPRTQAALALHARGLVVVPVNEDSKSPVGYGWKHKRPDAEYLTDLCQQYPRGNLGVLLGPAGGIIDIESDGANGEAEKRELFGGELPATMTAHSKRDECRIHHFFAWDDRLAGLPSTIKRGDVEFRLGTKNGSQSVVWGEVSGFRRWFTNTPPAKLPDDVIERILALAPATRQASSDPDDMFADLHARLKQLAIGKSLARAANAGLRVVDQATKDGIQDLITSQTCYNCLARTF